MVTVNLTAMETNLYLDGANSLMLWALNFTQVLHLAEWIIPLREQECGLRKRVKTEGINEGIYLTEDSSNERVGITVTGFWGAVCKLILFRDEKILYKYIFT